MLVFYIINSYQAPEVFDDMRLFSFLLRNLCDFNLLRCGLTFLVLSNEFIRTLVGLWNVWDFQFDCEFTLKTSIIEVLIVSWNKLNY